MAYLVKVRSFLGVAEAELARIRLAMAGIPARLSNAEMVIWFWHYSNVTGGVKLFVNESDVPQAALILSPQPVSQQFQPPQWICPKCQADVDGLWSLCWSCGTSKNGEEDSDFHAWYRESPDVTRLNISTTNAIAGIISALFFVFFICFNFSLVIVSAWLITLMLWVVISRCLSLHKPTMTNSADLDSEHAHFSDTHYDLLRDEFNPADETAYKLWKSAMFSFCSSIIFLPFALWLWYKTNQISSALSEKGLRYYFYSLIFIIFSIMLDGLMLLAIVMC